MAHHEDTLLCCYDLNKIRAKDSDISHDNLVQMVSTLMETVIGMNYDLMNAEATILSLEGEIRELRRAQ